MSLSFSQLIFSSLYFVPGCSWEVVGTGLSTRFWSGGGGGWWRRCYLYQPSSTFWHPRQACSQPPLIFQQLGTSRIWFCGWPGMEGNMCQKGRGWKKIYGAGINSQHTLPGSLLEAESVDVWLQFTCIHHAGAHTDWHWLRQTSTHARTHAHTDTHTPVHTLSSSSSSSSTVIFDSHRYYKVGPPSYSVFL